MPPAQFSHIDLRCPLFIPGNRSDMLGKARRYAPSAFVPDMLSYDERKMRIADRVLMADPVLIGTRS